MANGHSSKLQYVLEKEFTILDNKYVRKIQKQMYDCSSKCCEDENAPQRDVASCIDNCAVEFNDVNNYISTEFNSIQDQLQLCVTVCNKKVKYMLGSQPNQSQVRNAQLQLENCAQQCVENQIELLPNFFKNLHEVLGAKK